MFLKKICPLFAVIGLYFLDQLSKFFAVKYLPAEGTVPIIKNIIHLTIVYNTGAAFGMFRSKPHLVVVIAIFAVFLINFLLLRRSHVLSATEKLSLYLILAGTLGNLTDRLRFGHVVDFIDLRVWPVFNLADSFITVGAILLGLSIFIGFRR